MVGVLPRDRGAGRVRIGRDGEPIVTYRLADEDARRLAIGIDGAGKILTAAGAHEIFTAHARLQRFEGSFPPDAFRFGPGRGALYSFHIMGSARMGGSATMSAAGPTGETWDVQNLVIADGSAFPTASGVNPMITIEAIAHLNAHRLAERI
jgi:choline dehydrogenase-like flavoprotein